MPELLVTNPDNEFVGRLIASLRDKHSVAVSGDPNGQSHVLLSMPTDDGAAQRAVATLEGLQDEQHVLFIANEIDPTHPEVIEAIKASGNPWTILHPVAMMDFSFAALPPQISMAGVVFGISGRARMGFVAASDVMRVLAAIITGGGHEEQEYVLTGPDTVDMPEVTAQLAQVLGFGIDYIDLPEEELRTLMVQYGRQDPDMIERLVLSQLRAWRDGRCDVRTTSVADITGQEPLSVQRWFAEHREDYPKGQSLAVKAASRLVKARYRGSILT